MALFLFVSAALAENPLVEARKAMEAGDWSRAHDLAKPIAEKGNADAQEFVASILFKWSNAASDKREEALDWYLKAAEQGHVEAQRNAAALLQLLERHAEAVAWRKRIGDAPSLRKVAEAYRLGRGVSKDATKAVEWFRRAAEKGDATAQRELGTLLRDGQGVVRDPVEAESWYRKAFAQGDQLAGRRIYSLPPLADAARLFEQGKGLLAEGKTKEAVAVLGSAAEARNREAALLLAQLYFDATAVPYDETQLVHWAGIAAWGGRVEEVEKLLWRAVYKRNPSAARYILIRIQLGAGDQLAPTQKRLVEAGDAGNAAALATLGLYYGDLARAQVSQGNDGGAAYAQCLLHLWSATDRGDRSARKELYGIFLTGAGTAKDGTTAGRIAQAAAKDGEAWAQVGWGLALLQGSGVPKNAAAALPLFAKAGEQGNTLALVLLAQCCLAGRGTEKSESRAFALFSKAAELGDARAFHALGVLTVQGRGTDKDAIKGWALIARAAKTGYALSVKNIEVRAKEGVDHALYWKGRLLLDKDRDAGIALIRQAAEKKYAPAIEWLEKNAK